MQFQPSEYLVHVGLTIKASATTSGYVWGTTKPRHFYSRLNNRRLKTYFSSRPKKRMVAVHWNTKNKLHRTSTIRIHLMRLPANVTVFFFLHQKNKLREKVGGISLEGRNKSAGWGLTGWAKDWQKKLGEREKNMGSLCPGGWGFSAKCKSALMVRNGPSGVRESIAYTLCTCDSWICLCSFWGMTGDMVYFTTGRIIQC